MIYLYIYIYTYMYIYTMRTEMISRNCCSKTRYVFLEESHFWVHETMVSWKNTLRIPHFAPEQTRKTLICGHCCGKLPNYLQNPHLSPPQIGPLADYRATVYIGYTYVGHNAFWSLNASYIHLIHMNPGDAACWSLPCLLLHNYQVCSILIYVVSPIM